MLRPEYAKAADALKDNDKVAFTKIDATKNSDLAQQYGIEGFPTIKIFVDGEPSGEFSGQRTAEGFVAFVERFLRDPVTIVNNAEELKAALASEDAFVVGLFSGDSEHKTVFTETASKLRLEYSFYLVTDASLFAEVGQDNEIVVFSKQVPGSSSSQQAREKAAFKGDVAVTTDSLEGFIRIRSLPLFGVVNQDTFALYSSVKRKLFLLLVFDPNTEDTKFVQDVAAQLRDKEVLAGYLDASEMPEVSTELGVKESDFPAIVLDYTTEQHFVFGNRERTHDAILQFVDDVLSGKVASHVRSEAAPETNDLPVKVVVGSTFEEMVYRDEQDVLIGFFAPWCGHCKKLKPKYDQVAEILSGIPSIVIAAMDVSNNDPPKRDEFEIEGIPALFLVRKDGKIVKYDGDRDTKSIVEFVHEHTSTPFELPEVPDELSEDDAFEGLDLEAFQAMFANEFENEDGVDLDDADLGEVADERHAHEEL